MILKISSFENFRYIMVKTHNCRVKIENKTMFDMTYVREWYDSGRVADGFAWTDVAPGGHLIVNNYERDSSLLTGCSGYVTYQMIDTEFSIAFSNPYMGTNKLGVGLDGKSTWDDMSNHNYERFVEDVDLGRGVRLLCICQCTGGDENKCSVEVTSIWSASTSTPQRLMQKYYR